MNQIKIIKRETAAHLSPVRNDDKTGFTRRAKMGQSNAEVVVTDWIGEWREQKQKSAKWDLEYLLRFKSIELSDFELN